jgi:hypothetical protein
MLPCPPVDTSSNTPAPATTRRGVKQIQKLLQLKASDVKVLESQYPKPRIMIPKSGFGGKNKGEGVTKEGAESLGSAASSSLASTPCACITCSSSFCLECVEQEKA